MDQGRQKKYDVAFSFAGEERAFVEAVAKVLKAKGVRVFYDEFEKIDLWGKELAVVLDEIYRNESHSVVLFISKNYAEKMWTRRELKTTLSAALEEHSEFILPCRFDDTRLEGLSPTIGYLDLGQETPESLAAKIARKLTPEESLPVGEPEGADPSTLGRGPRPQAPLRPSTVAILLATLTVLAVLGFLGARYFLPGDGGFGEESTLEAGAYKAVEAALAHVEPLLQVSDALVDDPRIMRDYREFLRPFVAIDTAAEQAIIGVDRNDQRWLSLNPADRDQARDTENSIQWLEHQATFFLGDDMRELPVFNLVPFAQGLVFQEKEFGAAQVLANVQASLRVAQALGQGLDRRDDWPSSFFFPAFVEGSDRAELAELIGRVRSTDFRDLRNATRELESFCTETGIDNPECSAATIRWRLDRQ
ncbi:MAG: TIR domain-containing protein [Acidobacteriota bacterium]